MKAAASLGRLQTGVRNLDAILCGGLVRGTLSVLRGTPGSGKTILAHQIAFHNAAADFPILYFNTLSEPAARTIQTMSQFAFFDATKVNRDVHFIDLGSTLQIRGIAGAFDVIRENLLALKPGLVVIDSYRSFDDLSLSNAAFREFTYELAVQLLAWQTTTLLLGEYESGDESRGPLFSVADGLISMSQSFTAGEQRRILRVDKMRGTAHSLDAHSFIIGPRGIDIYAPRVTIHRLPRLLEDVEARCKTGITKLDQLLGEGIPRGSSLLVSGVAGTGKTVFGLEFIYRGVALGEKGIIFSFEETPERLLATCRGLGWDLQSAIDAGDVAIVFIAQPDILVDRDLSMIQERVQAMGAKRVALDSMSVFLHRIVDPQLAREKVFQLTSIVQNAGAVGFFATDIPYGSTQISRFGVEETVVDGVIILQCAEEGAERHRYVEVYKLRNTAHLNGRHSFLIGRGGLQIFPRYIPALIEQERASTLTLGSRVASGIPGLDDIVGGGLLERSSTLLSGSPGVGKTAFGIQFLLASQSPTEPGLLVTLEETKFQLLAQADSLGVPLRKAVDEGRIEIVYLTRERIHPGHVLTLLSDMITTRHVRRLFLDGASYFGRGGMSPDALRKLLADLVLAFKLQGVTSVIASESNELYFQATLSERGYSRVADNLIVTRYREMEGQLSPALRVIKIRGSSHDRGTFALETRGGILSVGERLGEEAPASHTSRMVERIGLRRRR